MALITISDVRNYRDLDQKIDATRFAAWEKEVQEVHLEPFLSSELFYDMINTGYDTEGTKYYKLLNGTTYTSRRGHTITYRGLKPYLCYILLSIAAREGNLFQTNVGTRQFDGESYPRARDEFKLSEQYMAKAIEYKNRIIDYLNENQSTYPLWQSTIQEDTDLFNMEII